MSGKKQALDSSGTGVEPSGFYPGVIEKGEVPSLIAVFRSVVRGVVPNRGGENLNNEEDAA